MRRAVLVSVITCLILLSGAAAAAVSGSPQLTVQFVDGTLAPGEETTLDVVVLNEGEVDSSSVTNPALTSEVTTARGVTVRVGDGDAPFDVTTGRQAVGNVPEGVSKPISFSVAVPADAEAGTYRLPVTVRYSYTDYISETSGTRTQSSVSRTFRVPVTVEERARFAVVDVASDASVGSAGTATVTVENVGSATARSTRLSLASANPALTVGGGESASRFAGTVEPGERRNLSYEVAVADGAEDGEQALALRADYRDDTGRERTAGPTWFGLEPAEPVRADLSLSEPSVRAGSEAAVRGTVSVSGGQTAREAVVVVTSPPAGVAVAETRVPVGDLRPGDEADFEIPVTVPPDAREGQRSMGLALEYESGDGSAERRTAGSRVVTVPVTDADVVALRGVNASVLVDSDDRLEVAVENVGDRELREVEASLAPRPPFSSASPTAFVGRLGPGESKTVGFHLSVSDDAVESTQALPVNVTAETADGDRLHAGTHRVAVDVTREGPTSSDPVILAVGVVVVAAALGVGWYWLRD